MVMSMLYSGATSILSVSNQPYKKTQCLENKRHKYSPNNLISLRGLERNTLLAKIVKPIREILCIYSFHYNDIVDSEIQLNAYLSNEASKRAHSF